MQLIVSNKVNEYFNVTEQIKDYFDYELFPGKRPILVSKWHGAGNALGGKPVAFNLRSTKYLKESLTVISENEVLPNPNYYFNNQFFKEYPMNVPQLIEAAKKSESIEALEESVRSHQGIAIDWALKKAEKENEFVAMANLSKLREIYPTKKGKVNSTLADKDKKAAMEVTIKTKDVSPLMTQIVFNKGKKIGQVVSETANNIVLLVKKAECDAFVKATQAIKGFTVESKKQLTPGK